MTKIGRTVLSRLQRNKSSCYNFTALAQLFGGELPPLVSRRSFSVDAKNTKSSEFLDGPDQVLPSTTHRTWLADSPVSLRIAESGLAAAKPMSVYTLFKNAVEKAPNVNALAVKSNGEWNYTDYSQYFSMSRTVGKAFISLGLDRYAGVCIMGFNSPQWKMSMFGSIFAGGISVGIYTTNSSDACQYVAKDSKAQIIVVENDFYAQQFMEIKNELPDVKAIIQWEGQPTIPGVLSWKELVQIGQEQSDEALDHRIRQLAVNQCCTLVYTSGTTGLPKGVMCSHDNLTFCGYQSAKIWNPTMEYRNGVSYLPLSHSAALLTEVYFALAVCGTVYYAQPDALRGVSLGPTLQEVRPSSFLAVPRVWEKIHEKVIEGISSQRPRRQAIVAWAQQQGLHYHLARLQQGKLSYADMLKFRVAKRLVLDKLKSKIGLDKAVNLVSGSAPLSREVHNYFLSCDLPITESYALTETSIVGTNSLLTENDYRPNSVGKVMETTEMKIESEGLDLGLHEGEGEICFRGRNVCMGYINNEEATLKTINDEGWLLTGDLGWMDKDEFVYISGRAKELIITAGGENIPPIVIEEIVKKELPIVSNAIVIGDKRNFLTMLLTIKCEVDEETGAPLDSLTKSVVRWCKERGVIVSTVTDLRMLIDDRKGPIAKAIDEAITKYNSEHAISNAQTVKRWSVLEHDFSLVTGEFNNTLKLKRGVVTKMYEQEINFMYSDDYPVKIQKNLSL